MNTVITFLLLTACVVNGQQTTCNVGYQTTCTDVDECQTNRGGCDTHATCKNTAGSFTCTCDAGYSGDGFTCTENFVNLGCFKDTTTRDFDGAGWSDTAMTVKMCLSECAKKGFKYAGLQGNSWCFCGNSYGKYGTATNCDRTCVGDTKDNCGGNMANSVWVSERNFESSHNIGCFADNMERDLIGAYWLSTSLSVDMCVEDCKYRGMSYAALQGSGWCMCGNTYGKHGASTSCNKACTGNANDICGGEFANSIWTTGVNVHYVGCFADTSDRDLNGMSMTETAVMTIQICLDNCRGKGFKYAGLQNQSYCFCGNSYGKHGTSTNCNQACIGNAKENCGGFGANAIWTTGTLMIIISAVKQ